VLTEDGLVEIDVPRDRNGSFEPQIVAKGETRLDGFDDKIISLYARGMTVREIQGQMRQRCLQGIKAIVERQERVPAKGDDDRFVLDR
jgi:putative transposase